MSTQEQQLAALDDVLDAVKALQAQIKASPKDDAQTGVYAYPYSGPSSYELGNTLCRSFRKAESVILCPKIYLMELAHSITEVDALASIESANIADILAEEGDKGMTLTDLASKANVDIAKLTQAMRVLEAQYLFEKVPSSDPIHYRNTSIGQQMVHKDPSCGYSMPSAIRYMLLREAGKAHKEAFKKKDKCAFELASGKSLFAYMEQMPGGIQFFMDTMRFTSTTQDPGILQDFPWAALGNAKVVDLGSGPGMMSMQLLRKYSNLTFVNIDQPSTTERALNTWKAQFPDLLTRVEFVSHDFFTPCPIKADVYVLRFVLHNWTDEQCVQILQNVPKHPGAKLLIIDSIIRDYNIRYKYLMDLMMNMLHNGRERTLAELESLTAKAGWKLAKEHLTRSTMDVIEFEPVSY